MIPRKVVGFLRGGRLSTGGRLELEEVGEREGARARERRAVLPHRLPLSTARPAAGTVPAREPLRLENILHFHSPWSSSESEPGGFPFPDLSVRLPRILLSGLDGRPRDLTPLCREPSSCKVHHVVSGACALSAPARRSDREHATVSLGGTHPRPQPGTSAVFPFPPSPE